ncbi:MAG TPA: peptide-methionine (S)-S-oxide reductase MsrA [Candidatus Saccharimonadia bacterium]|nr:peptide-methionine (S)-S-oxide reductase MsrA [Candidatus Saccharimonadia bacterium]
MNTLETATIAGGCFWCTEALFKRLKGVESVEPGYTGGHVENPSYEDVVGGDTGHAESIQIKFDPKEIPFKTILEIFMHTHNPTTLNRQDYDEGTQYRSAIFYHTEEQRKIAEELIDELSESGDFADPIVTELTPFSSFYPADDEHRDYYDNNKDAPYCRIITAPKVHKLLKLYGKRVKDGYKTE